MQKLYHFLIFISIYGRRVRLVHSEAPPPFQSHSTGRRTGMTCYPFLLKASSWQRWRRVTRSPPVWPCTCPNSRRWRPRWGKPPTRPSPTSRTPTPPTTHASSKPSPKPGSSPTSPLCLTMQNLDPSFSEPILLITRITGTLVTPG